MIFLFPVIGFFWPTGIDLGGIDYLREFWPWCLKTILSSDTSGRPNWADMWFVAYLFIYSMILLPLFLRIGAGEIPFIESATRFVTGRRGMVFLMAAPLFLAFAVLAPIWPFFRNNLYSDWGCFAYNMAAFYYGFIIARDPRWSRAFDRHAAA
jgi:hypothetical protein